MKTLGIIDIGSNTIRLVVVQFTEQQSYIILDQVKESVRLGKDMLDGNLHPIRIRKALNALYSFKNLCESLKTDEVIVVATEAVRRAVNQAEFLAMVTEETGFRPRVLSGIDEAYYDYFATVNSIDQAQGLVLDIGGSSMELIWQENRQACHLTSLPFGAINLSDQLNSLSGSSLERENQVKSLLFENLRELSWLSKTDTLIGIGGSFRNIAKIDKKKRAYPIEMDHNYHLTADEVNGIHQMVLNTAPSGRKEIKGLSSDRADIFIGATTAITSLLEYCGITDIYVSGYGLREGIIYEQMLTSRLPVNSVLDFSLENLLSKFRLNKHHARHVWFLSQTLFEQLILLHKIEASQVNILKTAALLHDCGINVNYYDHHLHSLYIILNSHINGLSHRELIMAAYTAAYHRKNNVKISEAHLSLLDYNDVGVIRKLGVILQIAEALDRRMQANVKRIDCQLEEDNVTLKLLAQHNPDLEIREALEASAAFCKLFGKQLYVVNG